MNVCKLVVESSGFNLRTKANFFRQLAYLQMKRSIDLQASSPGESDKLRDLSLFSNLNAYFCALKGADTALEAYLDQVIDSIGKRANFSIRTNSTEQFLKLCEQILSLPEQIDDFSASLLSKLELAVLGTKPEHRESIRRNMARLAGRMNQKDFCNFKDNRIKTAFTGRIKQITQLI